MFRIFGAILLWLYVDGLTVTVDKVRYCTREIFLTCTNWKTHPKYAYWSQEGVGDFEQSYTYLSEVYRPPKHNVKQLIFLAAGTQYGFGTFSAMTGTPSHWKSGWKNMMPSKKFQLPESSFPNQLINLGYASPGNTSFLIAYKHSFKNWLSIDIKQRMENAYYEWLKSSFDPEKIELIFLAGFSRGGCLAMRLAKRFNEEFPNIKLVVNSYDGICSALQNELGTQRHGLRNPLTNSIFDFGWITDLNNLFPNRQSGFLHVSLFLSGIPLPFSWLGDRFFWKPFTHFEAKDPIYEDCWILQEWLSVGHLEIGINNLQTYGIRNYLFGKEKVFSENGCNYSQ